MAFGDWDTATHTTSNTELGDVFVFLDVSTPILGSGSLSMGFQEDDFSPVYSCTAQLDSGFTRGLTKGRIRTLARWDGPWIENVAFIDQVGFGIYYMASDLDIANNASNFYFAGLVRERNVAGDVVPTIAKASSKILEDLLWEPGTADILIGSATHITGVVETDVIPIQIEWNLDLVGLGGLRHIMSVGSIGETNFNGLSVVYDFVEAASPLTTSLVEGIGFMQQDGLFGGALSPDDGCSFDDTGVFQLV